MRPLIESLLRIRTLRRQHTNRWMAQDHKGAEQINKDIIHAWNGYRIRECENHQLNLCFTCAKPAVEEFKVERPNATGPQLFCSAECCKRFGIMLGNT